METNLDLGVCSEGLHPNSASGAALGNFIVCCLACVRCPSAFERSHRTFCEIYCAPTRRARAVEEE